MRQSLLRKESFGGTLLLSSDGRREYISPEEFELVAACRSLSETLARALAVPVESVRVVSPPYLPSDNFSAPDKIFLELTRACNLTCVHCFNNSGKPLPEQLTHGELTMVVEDLAQSGVQEVRFTGGEPTMHPHLIELITQASVLGMRVSIGTHAGLINPRRAKKLAGAGLDSAVVSLDGLEDDHDRIRGLGAFRATMDGLEALMDAGVRVRVNSVLMRSTLDSTVALTALLVSRDIHVMLRRYIPAGRATRTASEMLTAEEYGDLKQRLNELFKERRYLVDGHYLGTGREGGGKQATPRYSPPFSVKSCSAGHRGGVILPTGHVQTCGFLAPLGELSVGKVPQETFSEIWRRLNESNHIKILESKLGPHNATTLGPKTNCLAIATGSSSKSELIQIRGARQRDSR